MSTKNCPSCGAEVPLAAARCKHCFHDFSARPKSRSGAILGILALLAVMSVAGATTMWYAHGRQATEKSLIDAETRSVVFTRTSETGTETDRVAFSEISKVELLTGGSEANWEVAIITSADERRVLSMSDDRPLNSYAKDVAELMDKPLVERVEGPAANTKNGP